jgi:hypothetical protein
LGLASPKILLYNYYIKSISRRKEVTMSKPPLHLVLSEAAEVLLEIAHDDRDRLREHLDLGSENWQDATPRDFDVWCKRRDTLAKALKEQLERVGSELLSTYERMKGYDAQGA